MFKSRYCKAGCVTLPEFTGLRIMMLPHIIGDTRSLPDYLEGWSRAITLLWTFDFYKFGTDRDCGKVGYLTIDEKIVQSNDTHRRAGLHVDGIYRGGSGKWGGGGGGWSSKSTGAITVSSHVGCRGWAQEFDGYPGPEGECDHLAGQCRPECEVVFEPYTAYWFDGLFVHESIIQSKTVARQFVRLSLPSNAPWFDGYTENPLGVRPTGEILPRREFMNA